MKGLTGTLVVGLGLILLGFAATGGPVADPAAEVRTDFVYNIVRFVEWPGSVFESPEAPLVLCAFTSATGRARLALLHGRIARGRPIRLSERSATRDLSGCHLAYVPEHRPAAAERVVAASRDRALLTIGEGNEFLARGGMIALVLVDGQPRLKVNLAAVQASGLKLSARILQLGQDVEAAQ